MRRLLAPAATLRPTPLVRISFHAPLRPINHPVQSLEGSALASLSCSNSPAVAGMPLPVLMHRSSIVPAPWTYRRTPEPPITKATRSERSTPITRRSPVGFDRDSSARKVCISTWRPGEGTPSAASGMDLPPGSNSLSVKAGRYGRRTRTAPRSCQGAGRGRRIDRGARRPCSL